jgi:hypothetical protein
VGSVVSYSGTKTELQKTKKNVPVVAAAPTTVVLAILERIP